MQNTDTTHQVHVVHSAETGRWHAKVITFFQGRRKGGKDTQLGGYPNKREAYTAGREAAIEHACELVVHGADGRFQRKHSYGHDPAGNG